MKNISLQVIDQKIPPNISPKSKDQREMIWQLWDKNQNGFVSLKDIQEELFSHLEIEPLESIQRIIYKSAEDVKKKFENDGQFGKNYIEKKQFRAFITFLNKHLKNKNQDNEIQQQQLIGATKLLTKWEINNEQREKAKKMTLERKLTFNKFQEWLDTFQYYNIKDIQKLK